jgi:hypothetical protein
MIVRLRFNTGPRIRKTKGKNRHVASAIAALMWPAVLTAYVLGVWGLGAQIQVTGAFGIAHGMFSHWQVWLATALWLHLATVVISRYGRNGELRLPSQLFSWITSFGHRRTL